MTRSIQPWLARIGKAFSDDDVLYSLTWFTTYLSTVSQAEPDRTRLLEMASEFPEQVALPWRRALGLIRGLGFDHAAAVRYSASSASSTIAEGLMDGFSRSVLAGTPAKEFFERARHEYSAQYFNYYERSLDKLEKWMGGFAATTVSVVLMISVMMVVALVFDVPTALIRNMASVAVGVTILSTYTLGRSSPVEARWLPDSSVPLQVWLKEVWFFIAGGGLFSAYLVARPYGFGGFLVTAGLFALPIGILSLRAERQIADMERSLPDLIRRSCTLAAEQRSTLSSAVQELPASGFGALSAVVTRLQCRLYYQLGEALCWRMFTRETGSAMVLMAVRTVTDALRQGTAPEVAGSVCTAMVDRALELRERRSSVSDPFIGVMLALYAVLTAILWLMLETSEWFGGQFQALSKDVMAGFPTETGILPTLFLHFPDTQSFRVVAIMLIVVLSLATSIVCVWIRGSHWLSGFFYLGLTLVIAGIVLIGVPMIAKSLYSFDMVDPIPVDPGMTGGG